MLSSLKEIVLLVVSYFFVWLAGEWNARRKIKNQKNVDSCDYMFNLLDKDTIEFLHEHDHNNLIPKKIVTKIHSVCSKIYQNKDFDVIHDKKLKDTSELFLKSLQIYAESLATLSFPHDLGDYFTIDVIDPVANNKKYKRAETLNIQESDVYKNYVSLVKACKKQLYL